MAEERRPALAEERRHRVVQRIPLEQRAQRGGRVRERPLHVRHPGARELVGGCELERGGRARCSAASGAILAMSAIMPAASRRSAGVRMRRRRAPPRRVRRSGPRARDECPHPRRAGRRSARASAGDARCARRIRHDRRDSVRTPPLHRAASGVRQYAEAMPFRMPTMRGASAEPGCRRRVPLFAHETAVSRLSSRACTTRHASCGPRRRSTGAPPSPARSRSARDRTAAVPSSPSGTARGTRRSARRCANRTRTVRRGAPRRNGFRTPCRWRQRERPIAMKRAAAAASAPVSGGATPP